MTYIYIYIYIYIFSNFKKEVFYRSDPYKNQI